MNGTSIEEETLTLLGSPTHSNVMRAKVVDPCVREGRRLLWESFYWELSHNGLNGGSAKHSARDTVRFNRTQWFSY